MGAMEARGLAGERARLPSRKQSSPEGPLPRPGPEKEGRPRLLRETLAAATPADRLPPRGCRAPRPDPGLERGAPGCRRPRAPWGPGGHRTPALRLCRPPPRSRRSTRGTFPASSRRPQRVPRRHPRLRRGPSSSSPSPAAQGSRLAQGLRVADLWDHSQRRGATLRCREMEGSGGGLRDAAHPGKESKTPRLAYPPRQPGLRADLVAPGPELQERDRKIEGSSGP